MYYTINNKQYKVVIERKNNKNTYIRIKNDIEIHVTTNLFRSDKYILNLIKTNENKIFKMLNKNVKQKSKDSNIYILGVLYDIITIPMINNIDIDNNKIYIKDRKQLDKYLIKKASEVFDEKYKELYNSFEEEIPFYKLKIRKMKTRWGVCNRRSKTITLNLNLIHYNIECLEYVIVHELAHLIHFDHSKKFWDLVEKYKKDYKKIRKQLKE